YAFNDLAWTSANCHIQWWCFPCVMCIYERVAMLGVGGAALFGTLFVGNGFNRYVATNCGGVPFFYRIGIFSVDLGRTPYFPAIRDS
ncbi:hypothetical protein SC81_22845, partial [Vibrio vulnificus]